MASQQQLSEEELRQYIAQLREAPVADLLTQAYTMLGAWAEAKLGRGDARALIDGLAGLVQAAASSLPADLVKQMREGLSQLQLLQVQAEQQLAAAAQQQPPSSEREQQSADASGARTGGPQATRGQPSQPERPMTDRLWIPGRDPRPR